MKLLLLIKIKIPTIVGILTFMSGKNSSKVLYELENVDFLDTFIFISIINSCSAALSIKNIFITSGPGLPWSFL